MRERFAGRVGHPLLERELRLEAVAASRVARLSLVQEGLPER